MSLHQGMKTATIIVSLLWCGLSTLCRSAPTMPQALLSVSRYRTLQRFLRSHRFPSSCVDATAVLKDLANYLPVKNLEYPDSNSNTNSNASHSTNR